MISVITPVHKKSLPFLRDAFQSLLNQTNTDWEWIIGLNGGATCDYIQRPNVKPVQLSDDDAEHNRIGRLKRECAEHALGSVLVELDADDMLTPDALEKIAAAFRHPAVQMVYSNHAEFRDGTWEPNSYAEQYGWRTRPFTWGALPLIETLAFPPGPHMMSRIWWAPNHVRAWRTSTYWAFGGHNPEIKTGDDHDLCCRFYIAAGASGIKHLDECLYLYRVHDQNSCVLANAEVQRQSNLNYLRYHERLALRWAKDNNLPVLDLGGRLNAPKGYTTVDLRDADVIADLNGRWPFEDSSVGVLRAHHVFEHLPDSIHTMNEAFRVLAPGGWLLCEVPSATGKGAFRDPTHRSFWVDQSFWYYTNRDYSRFIPEFTGRFQAARIEQFDLAQDCPVVAADLICLKPPYTERPSGEVLI